MLLWGSRCKPSKFPDISCASRWFSSIGQNNVEQGEKSLNTLKMKYHAALRYRRLRYPESANLPEKNSPGLGY